MMEASNIGSKPSDEQTETASSSSLTVTVPLEDDKNPSLDPDKFDRATLEISNESSSPNESQATIITRNQPHGSNFSRDRPGSVIGRTSVRSTSSRTSMKPGIVKSDSAASSFYCYKESHFDAAVANSKYIIKPELDGELKSAWLLTEIDHWDYEREKLVFITDNSMFLVKYNFINDQVYEYRRIMLHIINSINVGDFHYPNMSLMPNRQHGGIQIRWDKERDPLTFGQRWNPWCTDIPWSTLAHHPLIYNPKENETATYNVDEFFESLVSQISQVLKEKNPGENLTVVEGAINIESYAGLPTMVFNSSSLGFYKDRNGMCM